MQIFSISSRAAGCLLLAVLALVAFTVGAQTPIGTLDPAPFYHWQHPRPVGELLNDLHVFNDSGAVVVTRTNYAIRTTNGGRTWRYQELGLMNGLETAERITFVGDTLGWVAQQYLNAAGNRSGMRIKRTLNGGRTWTMCLERRNVAVRDIQFVTRRVGFVLYQTGLTVYLTRTTDGGQTWTAPASSSVISAAPGFYGWANDLHFSTPAEGWVAGGYTDPSATARGCILHTTDGGTTWQRQTPLGDSAVDYTQVAFAADGQHGWAVATDRAYRTNNGGQTWLPSPNSNYGRYSLTAFSAQRAALGWRVTADGGVTWQDSGFYQIGWIRKIVFTPAGRGWGIGNEGGVFRTTRFGLRWQSDSGLTLNRVAIRRFEFGGDARRGWVRRTRRFPFRTTTRGRRWEAVNELLAVPALWQLNDYQVADVAIVDFDTATALMAHRNSMSNIDFYNDFLRTTDGGRTWQVQPLPGMIQYLGEVAFYNSRHGCAVGSNGQAVITHDGGQTWQQVYTGTTRRLQNISWASPQRLSVSAWDSALVLISNDGGQTWQRTAWPGGPSDPIAWKTPTEGWIGGGGYNFQSATYQPFARSFNDFQTYTVVPNVSATTLSVPALNSAWQGLRFLDSTRAVVRDGRPMYSADGGITWQVVSERATLPPVHGLIDRYNGWFGGQGYYDGGSVDGILHYSEKYLQADTALATAAPYCTGDSLALAFARTGSFGATEQAVVAELSDAHGRFGKYPRVVGQGTASPLTVRLPATLPAGTGYLLRVSRSDHSVIGGDNEHNLSIYPRPAAVAVAPLDSARICAGDSVQLSAPVGYGQYRWLDGDTARTRWVRAAGAYAVEVALGGGCFGPASRPVVVRLTPRPAAPALTRTQAGSGPAQLTAGPALAGATYVWTGPAGVVAGATGPTLLLTGAGQNGNYSVAVTQRGCASVASAAVNVLITGLPADETAAAALTLTPNPAADGVTVTLAGGGALRTLLLTDLAGRRVLAVAAPKVGSATVDLRAVPVGTYLLCAVATDGRAYTRRLVVAR